MRINSISACQPHIAANNNNAKNAQNQNFGLKMTKEVAKDCNRFLDLLPDIALGGSEGFVKLSKGNYFKTILETLKNNVYLDSVIDKQKTPRGCYNYVITGGAFGDQTYIIDMNHTNNYDSFPLSQLPTLMSFITDLVPDACNDSLRKYLNSNDIDHSLNLRLASGIRKDILKTEESPKVMLKATVDALTSLKTPETVIKRVAKLEDDAEFVRLDNKFNINNDNSDLFA